MTRATPPAAGHPDTASAGDSADHGGDSSAGGAGAGRLLAFVRNARQGISVARQQSPDAAFGAWLPLGGQVGEWCPDSQP